MPLPQHVTNSSILRIHYSMPTLGQGRCMTTGAELIARGAIDGGCRFFAGYPITPASGIMARMVELLPRVGGIGMEAEDEIAALGMCLGASSAGMRPMTATSGPGISLFSENIGFAQMAELPVVIVDSQRMGPATGGATTNTEGDIQFVRWVTAGGYPIIALCPSRVEECYSLAARAFALAERFRSPVFLMVSKDMVMNRDTVDLAAIPQAEVAPPRAAVDSADHPPGHALPYRFARGDAPAGFAPLGGPLLTRVNTSIHDEDGNLTRSPVRIERMLHHLSDKITEHEAEWSDIEVDMPEGPEPASVAIVAYGMTARSSREAARRLRAAGVRVVRVAIRSLWPVPQAALRQALEGVPRIVVPEHNLGQYVLEIQRLFGDRPIVPVQRIDGRQISPEAIEAACRLA